MDATAVRPAKSPAFSDVMLLSSITSIVTVARFATVTAAQSLTPESCLRISSCTCCVRSQMPDVWACAGTGRASAPRRESHATAASTRAERTSPRRAPARRGRPAGRPAADAVDGEGWPPRRDGRRSGERENKVLSPRVRIRLKLVVHRCFMMLLCENGVLKGPHTFAGSRKKRRLPHIVSHRS